MTRGGQCQPEGASRGIVDLRWHEASSVPIFRELCSLCKLIIFIYLLQHHINWPTSFKLWPVTMFSHFVACCVYGQVHEFTIWKWVKGIAAFWGFVFCCFPVNGDQKWDPSPDLGKALKNDAALLRRVERSLDGVDMLGWVFARVRQFLLEVLSNLIIVRLLVLAKNCLTAVQAWVIQFNNFMQDRPPKRIHLGGNCAAFFQAFVVLQQSRWASLSLLDCRCLSPKHLRRGKPESIHSWKAWKRVMLI